MTERDANASGLSTDGYPRAATRPRLALWRSPRSGSRVMTATHAPGLPIVEDGLLVSTNPATGEAAARVPIARADDVAAAVERAWGARSRSWPSPAGTA